MSRGESNALTAYIRKEKKSQINDTSCQIMKIEIEKPINFNGKRKLKDKTKSQRNRKQKRRENQ